MSDGRALVEQASAILLDFDGPVCSVFSGRSAASIAAEMRERLAWLDGSIALHPTTDDPLLLLRAARDHSAEGGGVAEELLATAELEAVRLAEPTDGSREFLAAMHRRATPVAIVSNNGERAIRAYLERHELSGLVAEVSARDPFDARLMKPHPATLLIAMSHLHADPATTVMVGDSESDIVAAHASQVQVVAYANKPHKAREFEEAQAEAIVSSMRELIG